MQKLLWVIQHPLTGVYATPVVLGVGFYFALTGPQWWEDFFLDHALGFLISFWIGAGFAFMWWMVRRSAKDMPGGQVTAALIGITGIVLVGGLSVFSDPSLFAVAVWPGLTMLAPELERRLAAREQTAQEQDQGQT